VDFVQRTRQIMSVLYLRQGLCSEDKANNEGYV
jgi:hypothetical protein